MRSWLCGLGFFGSFFVAGLYVLKLSNGQAFLFAVLLMAGVCFFHLGSEP